MKTSHVLASLLCSSIAAAVPHHQHVHKHAPFHKRALVTKTEVLVETVIIYTTVYPDEIPSATAAPTTISEPGLFYERPSSKAASSSASSSAAPSSSAPPAFTPPPYTPPVEIVQPSSSSVYIAPPPSSSSVYTPPPVPSSSAAYTPPVVASPVYTPPPAQVSSAAPVQSSAPASPVGGGGGGGNTYSGDITIYDNTGAAGACGNPLTDTMEVCAIAHGLWEEQGGSKYNVMTGAAENPYCGKIATITYNGNTAQCEIQDMCPGCAGDDLDLSVATWKKLTGSEERTRYKATWSVAL